MRNTYTHTLIYIYINFNTIDFVFKGIIFFFMVCFHLLARKLFWQGLVKCSKGIVHFHTCKTGK